VFRGEKFRASARAGGARPDCRSSSVTQ
jgi:hypothetical protein